MKIIGIIPARMESSRFPGKPMEKIAGMPMIGHVYKRALMSKRMDEVYVATCNHEIKDYIESIGGKALMTSSSHQRCTDRVSEAVGKVELETQGKIDIVVLIQGDEPMLTPQMIDEAIAPIIESKGEIKVTNLMARLNTWEECMDPNEIKVVVDLNKNALYFSRSFIPFQRQKSSELLNIFKQVCIIPFTRDYLTRFSDLEPTPLEVAESIDMLRILEHGEKVRMVETKDKTYSVDTKEDLIKVEKIILKDQITQRYL
jgi:3-deoxy-manno-octulosonate cytidylyltransferase (CMP-KDO synthetase)